MTQQEQYQAELQRKINEVSSRASALAIRKYEELDIALKKLEEERTLPEQLVAVLEKVKDNPVDEKEIYEIIKKDTNLEKVTNIALKILTKEEIEASSAVDIAILVKTVEDKITSFRDSEGQLKTTAAMAEMKLPNLFQMRDIQKAADAEQDKVNAKNSKTLILILKSTGLKDAKLTDWEIDLLINHVAELSNGMVWSTPMGKH